MNRLPSYDVQTGQAEWRIFFTLTLAAVALIAIAAWNGLQFASERDEMLLAPATENVARIEAKRQIASTNLTIYKSSAIGERSRPGGLAAPKS
jgi:hypothetical protein